METHNGVVSIDEAMANDTRGWIMACVSGVACIIGAGIVCIDVLSTKLLGAKAFKLVESQAFLSSSLSLSAGVLMFTSLYSMLPESAEYLQKAKYTPTAASFMMIGLFVFGVVAIRIISTFIHSHLPSSVVECEPHEHHDHNGNRHHHHHHKHKDLEQGHGNGSRLGAASPEPAAANDETERTPLLQSTRSKRQFPVKSARRKSRLRPRQRSLGSRISQQISAVMFQTKPSCDENGRCFGFSQPCRDDCVRCGKHPSPSNPRRHSLTDISDAERSMGEPVLPSLIFPNNTNKGPSSHAGSEHVESPDLEILDPVVEEDTGSPSSMTSSTEVASPDPVEPHLEHHHHVPRDEFMSLGLQTSLAIALHKLPEGFITYATNHANPTLGWSVFIALFIHNITEGFAMCLPLFLALDSRLKAMIWSTLLGGISQPAGAGIAALWIWGVRKGIPPGHDDSVGSGDISWAVYGGMFAATAGIMTNVALQLFSEALHRSPNHSMCIGFAIAGMAILGLSFALTAE